MKREHICGVRLTEDERESVKREAAKVDRSMSAYLRWLHFENVAAMEQGAPADYNKPVESL